MSGQFSSLITAILDNDLSKVNELLATDPELATQASAREWLEPKIAHWIYAGDSALHVAAAGYRVEIIKKLLATGANVGALNRRGAQPLHYAADGSLESSTWNAKAQAVTIHLLIKAGANVRALDKNGATPLHRAVRTRCAIAAACLLEAGSDPTLKNKPGSTPFHLAVQNTGRGGSGAEKAKIAQREIIQNFLDHGLRPSLKDSKGKSVLSWARSDWVREILTA